MAASRRVLAGALLLVASACAHLEPDRCAASPGDAEAVSRTIRSYFAALAAGDEAAAANLTSPSFYSFDAGKRFTGPELVAAVKEVKRGGTVLQWNIGSIDTHVDCNAAWAAWENVGAAGPAGAVEPVKWLESAMLRREQGHWRLEFLHSSRAQR